MSDADRRSRIGDAFACTSGPMSVGSVFTVIEDDDGPAAAATPRFGGKLVSPTLVVAATGDTSPDKLGPTFEAATTAAAERNFTCRATVPRGARGIKGPDGREDPEPVGTDFLLVAASWSSSPQETCSGKCSISWFCRR